MRTRTLLPARVSLAVVLVSMLGSCTPRTLDHTLAERPVFVELPAGGVATPSQRAAYQNNPVAVERYERRCTYKPAKGTACDTSVELRIRVVEGAKLVAAGGHPRRPLLLALIENKGTRMTFDSILPGENALVATNKAIVGRPTETVVKLVRFQQTIGSPNFSVSEREYGVLRSCYPHYSGRSSDMSFRGCDPRHWAMHGGSLQQGVLVTSLVSFARRHGLGDVKKEEPKLNMTDRADYVSMDDPLWLRCSPGCCTS